MSTDASCYIVRGFLISVLSCALLAVQPAWAGPDHNEDDGDDAGGLIGTATDLTGLGQITSITGSLSSTDRQDMFKIRINNPGSFEFGISGPPGFPFTDIFQTQLWLFDSKGQPIMANTVSPDPNFTSLLSTQLVDGGPIELIAGDYYLAITEQGDAAQSVLGDLFSFAADDEISGPDGPGAELGFEFWGGSVGDGGSYSVSAIEIPIPGPGALGLLAVAGLLSRRRRI